MTPEDYANSRVSELIDEYIHNARNREILRDNLVDGMTYDQLAGKQQMDRSEEVRFIQQMYRDGQ